ncbi:MULTISPECIES: hypothetical protein [Paenibacillus]|uniref:hypothetical protein n=1 Tax=Paenibacillus TaxID=44249 RepID=UPI00089FFA18|nr:MULTISPECIES: hypothetical protein [Paenibacillus]MEC0249299.1 hypothetical protein [Paenibacillus chitinolyticus]SEG18126.1 hypothetical protein SAMN02799616_02164 [Paenibacillus sp. UNC499MF]
MTTKTLTVPQRQKNEREVGRLFSFMNLMAWSALVIGVIMSLWNVFHFSDKNLTLMVGIGFMVGSVFIYTIGTAIHLVHERKFEQQENGEVTE